MKRTFHFFIGFTALIFFISCATSNNYNRQTRDHKHTQTGGSDKDILTRIFNELELSVATQYFESQKKPRVNVHIKKVSSNYDDEPLLAKYIHSYMVQGFQQKYQIRPVPFDHPAIDCVIDIHIIRTPQHKIQILSNIINTADNKIIYTVLKEYNRESSSFQKYLAYKNDLQYNKQARKVKDARLVVKAINKGKAFEDTNYYRYTSEYSSYSYYRYSPNKLISSFYPAEHECSINGDTYRLNAEKIFYNDKIIPGRVEFIVSFRAGTWDAVQSEQRLGRRYSKRFYVDVRERDKIMVDLTFIYDGKHQDIVVKAYRKTAYKIKRQGSIQTSYEPIDVYSK
jgi:hypothetical protein